MPLVIATANQEIILEFNPSSISESMTAKVSEQAVLRRANPFLLYGSTAARQVTLSGILVENQATLDLLKGLTLPTDGELPLATVRVDDTRVVTGYVTTVSLDTSLYGASLSSLVSMTILEQGLTPVLAVQQVGTRTLTDREVSEAGLNPDQVWVTDGVNITEQTTE